MQKENSLLCYKYLIRLIKSEKQLHELAASYIETAVKNGMDEESALLMYCGLIIRRTGLQEQYDFLSVNGARLSEQEFLEYIKSDQVKKYSGCTKFAESIDLQCLGCCKLCAANSGRTYLNSYHDEELQLLKFVNSSFENMTFFKSNASATVFKCQTDLASEMISDSPIIISLHRTLYQKLSGQKETFFRNSEKDRLVKIMPTVFTTIAKTNALLLELMKDNPALLNTYIDVYISDILDSTEITQDSCLKLLDKIGKKKNNKSSKHKIVTYSLFDIAESEELPVANQEPESKTPSFDDDRGEIVTANSDENNIKKSDEAMDSNELPEFLTNEDPASADTPKDTAEPSENENSGDDELPFPIDTVIGDDTESKQETSEEQSDNTETDADIPFFGDVDDSVSPSNENAQEDVENTTSEEQKNAQHEEVADVSAEKSTQTTTKHPAGREIPLDSLEDFIIKNVSDRAVFTREMIDYVNEENKIFAAINKSKVLPVEIFSDDNQFFFVLWIKELGKYAYTMANNIPVTLKVLLEHKSILKICYQPYYLYSLGKILGIKLKNIHSIYTYDRALRKDSNLLFKETTQHYIDLLEYKPEPKDYGKGNLNLLLNTMPLYVYIAGRQEKMADELSDVGLERYNELVMRDYVVGVSFMRAVNLNDFSVLCTLDSSNRCHFNTDFVRNVKADGFIVTYNITSGQLTLEQVHNLYKSSLIDLATKGRFRKLNIQLLAIYENNMIIFYGIDEYELLVTLMQNYYNTFAISNRIKDFKLVVDHKRYYADPDKESEKKEMKVHSLEGVLDALATVDAKVEVKDTHIKREDAITTNKRKIKSQTNTFPPRRE